MRRLVLVEVEAVTPLQAEIIVGRALADAGVLNYFVRQTNVVVEAQPC